MDPVDPVVGAHYRPRARLLDHPLESRQVDLAQRTFIDVCTYTHTIFLLVVDREVLDAGTHSLTLDASNQGGCEHAGEHRILGEIFEVPAAERRTFDVDAWPEQNRNTGG